MVGAKKNVIDLLLWLLWQLEQGHHRLTEEIANFSDFTSFFIINFKWMPFMNRNILESDIRICYVDMFSSLIAFSMFDLWWPWRSFQGHFKFRGQNRPKIRGHLKCNIWQHCNEVQANQTYWHKLQGLYYHFHWPKIWGLPCSNHNNQPKFVAKIKFLCIF